MLRGMLCHVLFAACMCLAPAAQAATSAQNANSIYAGVLGGVTLVPDIAIKQLGTSQDLEMDAGFNFGGVIGYKWAFGLRAEGEISYRRNDNDKFAGVPIDGNVNALTFMGNAWYDFHTGTAWLPYVGGGLGVARVAADASVLGIQIVDDNDTVFAWQVGGGIGYEVSPGIVVSADYRYLATTDPSMTDGGGIDFDAEYSSHNIMIGVRGHF